MKLEKFQNRKIKNQEMKKINGGFTFFSLKIHGVLDGIPNNTTSDCTILGIKLW
jgi:hypothetical protein